MAAGFGSLGISSPLSLTGTLSGGGTVNNSGKILDSGQLGDGDLTVENGSAGLVDAALAAALVINTGAATVTNAGTIESTGPGNIIIGAVDNSGTLAALTGGLTVDGAVTGGGAVRISAGTADFTSSFGQNVTFVALLGVAPTGVLEPADSQGYAGRITGYSKTGATSLDLRDITFGTSTKATYLGGAFSFSKS